MTEKILLLCALISLSTLSIFAQQESDEIFDPSVLHEIRIEFDKDNFWEIMKQNYETGMAGFKGNPKSFATAQEFYAHFKNTHKANSESKIEYLEGKVTFDGDVINNVGVRLKGYSSYYESEFKKSIKLDFNEFVDTQIYKGVKKVNLNNGVGDPSFQRDFISYYMMRKAGIAAPRVSFAKVFINDKYWGLYTLVEQVDKTFLQNNFVSGNGNLYKALWNTLEYHGENLNSYEQHVEIKTNHDENDGSDYINFVKSLKLLSGTNFNDSIQKLINIDNFFKVFAFDVISKNWDSYMFHGRNFYLYHEPVSDLFYWIPWDYNLAWDGNFNWFGGEWPNPCDSNYTFTYKIIDSAVAFKLEAKLEQLQSIDINANTYWKSIWDFSGDDTTVIITDTTAILYDTIYFEEKGIYNVYLNIRYNDCETYKEEKVITIDSSEIKCASIYTMNRPYSLVDPVFDEVFTRDRYCCDCQWDALCDNMYSTYPEFAVNAWDYPILYQSERNMIQKLLKNSNYKNRYLDAFKFILDSVFNDKDILEIITTNTDLIRDAVYADTNLIFTTEDFENDAATSCDHVLHITSLVRLVQDRKKGLDREFSALGYQAKPVSRVVQFNDVVINEFMTSRSEADTTYKSDWIELYNNTSDIIQLNGFWLSDKKDTLKYKFPESAVIKPDGYVIVWADNKDKKNGMHAGFKLSAGGEDVLLFHEKYDTIDVVSYEYVNEDSVYARIPNGTGSFVIMYPTFNRNNEGGKTVGIEQPVYSQKIVAYPNPASSTLYLEADTYENYTIELFDTMGKQIRKTSNSGKLMQFDVSDIPTGFYLLKVKHGNQHYSSKIAIQH